MTISGPEEHITMAMGGPKTGGLNNMFGIGNHGHYFLTMAVAQYAKAVQAERKANGMSTGEQCHVMSLIGPGNNNMIDLVFRLMQSVKALQDEVTILRNRVDG